MNFEYKPQKPAIIKPFCRGCAYFHGHTYRATALVCALHPYGPEGESCPDWERKASRPLPKPEHLDFPPTTEDRYTFANPRRRLWESIRRRLRRHG